MSRHQQGVEEVRSGRLLSGIALGVLVAAGIAVAPAIGAPEKTAARSVKIESPVPFHGFGTFTPAAADPRLAAIYARGGLDTGGFTFTPSDSRRVSNRAVTLAVRSRSSRPLVAADRTAAASTEASTVSLAPVAYSLGVAVGFRRFALSGDVTKIDLAGAPGSREAVDVGVSYAGKRFSGQLRAGADRPLAGTPRLIEQGPVYSVDLAGSYRLTHSLDVTAGVRYKSERDRLQKLSDDRRDSKSVYVGTAFHF
ncbi:hypothetical protein QH494_16620 [Sphingomonas sp. AR_OL41]|uniref:hypothetical protein n=1 Tax=Sphingomonas sp. AR_OL41 TaxID=3042729 RepID=UPI0024818CD7|nr:hypothetical protein [Sphingomonas sp. AR_OL41]MDH7973816.1 hypothetical protein [Sphingomonas sp. AR_OL41]